MTLFRPNTKIERNTRGFTLVELLVSVGIFGVVSTISVGTLLIMVDANRKAQSVTAALTNLSYVMDSITRNIRTGYNYNCFTSNPSSNSLPTTARDCDAGNSRNAIAFTDSITSVRTGFRLSGTGIQRMVVSSDPRFDQKWLSVTTPDIRIDNFSLVVEGAGDSFNENRDTVQPRVLLVVSGVAYPDTEQQTEFNLQTDITQRTLD